MPIRLKADGQTGKVAIYFGTDDEPFENPLDHVARLRFHSDLEYPAVVSKHTGTVSLTSMGANTIQETTHVLFAHGQGGIPFVEGTLLLGANTVSWAGSVPVAQGSWSDLAMNQVGLHSLRFLHLGANATNVVAHEYSVTSHGDSFGALNVDFTVYLTDRLV